MKIRDLNEYNKGIQDPNSNAKNSMPASLDPETEKEIAKGLKMVDPTMNGRMAAKGLSNQIAGKKPTPNQLQQKSGFDINIAKAVKDPALRNQMKSILKKAGEMDIDENTLAKKILKKLTSKKPGKSIRKKSRLLQEIDQNLFEINYNSPEIAKKAVDLPIRCGFEAETVWPNFSRGGGEDVDNMSYGEVEDIVYISNSDQDYIQEAFDEYVRENLTQDYLSDIIDNYIEEKRDDDDVYTDFIEDGAGPTMDAVEEYRDEFKNEDPTEFENRMEDGWEKINWVREFVDQEFEDEILDYIREIIEDEGNAFQEAFEEAHSNTSYDEWIGNEFYSMSSFLDDYGIDYSEIQGGGLENVAERIYEWSKDTEFDDYPETGDYGDTSTDGWAVENDSSIEGSGCGAEIISPVYQTPKDMLKAMQELFNHISGDAETNSSTGLHVTMSWDGERAGKQSNAEVNKLKIASLLGDQYLLSTFGREKNSYAKSQEKRIKKSASNAIKLADKGNEAFKDIEDIMSQGVSGDKFVAVNFKDQRDNRTGTNLIEFRIGGGNDYHTDMETITKAVIRYATVMEAGYTDAYNKDYANAIYKMVSNAGKIDPKDIENAKTSFNLDDMKEPLVDLFKSLLSKENYFDGLEQIVKAYKSLHMIENVTEATVEEKQAELLSNAQLYYTKGMAHLAVDVGRDKNRNKLNAKSAGVIRRSLAEFSLDEKTLSQSIIRSLDRINIPTQNDRTNQKVAVISKGLNELFKKDIFISPDFLSQPQAERIAKGSWNAIHSKGWDKAQQLKLIDLLIKVNHGKDYNIKQDNISNMRYSIVSNIETREFNDFYSNFIRSGYNSNYPPAQPGEPYYPAAYKELVKFLNSYEDYNEPVSPEHNTNISSGDSYIENYLNTYVMKLRKRFMHFADLRNSNMQLYLDSVPQLGKISQELMDSLSSPLNPWTDKWSEYVGKNYPDEEFSNDYDDLFGVQDGNEFLGLREYEHEKIQELLKKVKDKEYTDPLEGNVVDQLGDRLTETIRNILAQYYKKKVNWSNMFALKPVQDVTKVRFDALKKWMKSFDEIAVKQGFDSQEKEIADKQIIDKREKRHQKNQANTTVTLNIPSHSTAYIRKDLYNNLTDSDRSKSNKRAALVQNRRFFTTKLNSNQVFVLPAAHWSQAEDAYEIQKSESDMNKWREDSARKVMKAFYKEYGISYDQFRQQVGEYLQLDGRRMQELNAEGLTITHDGDSREPNVEPLVAKSETEQPGVGTPMSISSAAAWHVNNPELSKKAKAADDKEDIAKGKDLIKAAGVAEYDEESSGTIGHQTDWEKLATHLGIEVGVNDQGVNLLNRVYVTMDSDHTAYRSEDDRPIVSIERWVLAVKDAAEYIKKNYNVSGGNYFRKDSDGNDGDDVKDVYSTPNQQANTEYETARADHPGFNTMMRQGINGYMKRGAINDLVNFLNGPLSKSQKDKILKAIIKNRDDGGLPLDYNSAMSLGVGYGNESTLNKFDKLSLQEQLDIIRNSKVLDLLVDKKVAEGNNKKPKLPKQNNPVAKHSRNMAGAGAHKSPKDYDRKKVKDEIKKELRDSTKVNTTMNNVFEQFEKLSLEKQLELLNSPVVEGYFNKMAVDKKEMRPDEFNKKYPQHAEPVAQPTTKKAPKQNTTSYNKQKHMSNTLAKFKRDGHDQKTAQDMLNSMIDKGAFDKKRTESLIGIDLLSRTKKLTENMPNNNKLNIIKGLLSKHFPVGDLAMQFKAYTAMPIPSMMNAFSQLQSVEGPDACARDILTHFCKHRLPDDEIKKLNLKESYIKEDDEESRLNSIMKAMQDNPTFANRVYKMLKLEKGSEGSLDIEDRLMNQDTGKEKDHRINKNILRKLVTSLEQLDHDFDQINAFVETYGHADYVNTDLLNKSGVFSIKDMLVGSDSVSKEFIFDLYESLFDFRINISGSNRGPGELGLCLLSPNVELASVGDIKVNGEEIEVKGEVSSGGGRMVNGIDDFKFSGLAQVKSQLVPFYEKFDVPEEFRIYNLKGAIGGGRNQGQAHILDQAQQLEQIKQGVGAEFLKLIVSTYQFVIDSEEEAELTSSFMNMDKAKFLTLVGRMSFKNYASKLNAKGFNRLVFLNWRHDKVVNCTTEEFSEYSDHLAFTSLDMADSQNGPAVQVSVKK
jgi:hypothetical protein